MIEYRSRWTFRPDPCEAIDPVLREIPQPNPELYDVFLIGVRTPVLVFCSVTPLILLCWASNLGYQVEIDEDGDVELWTRSQLPRMDYLCVQQNVDLFAEYPREQAVELAKWM